MSDTNEKTESLNEEIENLRKESEDINKNQMEALELKNTITYELNSRV